MSKSITQDMRYRQSLMRYAAKYGVSRASRKYNKSRSHIYFWMARWDGSMASSLSIQKASPPSKPAHRGRTEAHPKYAEKESHTGDGGIPAPASKARLHPLPGKPVSGHAQAGNASAAKGQNALQGKTIRTDAISLPACAGGCEGGAAEMSVEPGRTPVPVYSDRRIYTPSLSGVGVGRSRPYFVGSI